MRIKHTDTPYVGTKGTATPAQVAAFLKLKFAETVPEFREKIAILGERFGFDTLETYRQWREYSDACYDQSALLFEFEQVLERKQAKPMRTIWDSDGADGELLLICAPPPEPIEDAPQLPAEEVQEEPVYICERCGKSEVDKDEICNGCLFEICEEAEERGETDERRNDWRFDGQQF